MNSKFAYLKDADFPLFVTFLIVGFVAAWEHLPAVLIAAIIMAIACFICLMRKLSRECSEIVAQLTGTPTGKVDTMMKDWPQQNMRQKQQP